MRKDTVVILHGWNLSGPTFAPLVSTLKKRGYRCLAPDLPGFGRKDQPVYPLKLRDYVRFIEQYLAHHRIAKPVLIGHSFGGRVSLKYLELHPGGLKAMILTGTPGFTPVPRSRLFLFITIAKLGRIIFSIPPLTLFQDWLRRWYYYLVGARDFFRAEGAMRNTFKNVVQEDLADIMESVTIPCLLIWGEYDIVVPVAIAHRMKEVIPAADLKVIPEADHGVAYKQPEVFANYVDLFLRSVSQD